MQLGFLCATKEEQEDYFDKLYKGIVREALELQSKEELYELSCERRHLESIFGLFNRRMLADLERNGQRDAEETLKCWTNMNDGVASVSPVAIDKGARAFLSSQESLASSERCFSDFGRIEGDRRQSTITSTLEMIEIFRAYVLS